MGRKDDQTNSTADPFGFGSGGFDSPLASKSAKVPSDPFGFGTGGFLGFFCSLRCLSRFPMVGLLIVEQAPSLSFSDRDAIAGAGATEGSHLDLRRRRPIV